jgi:predicted nucleotidyltransferase
MVHVNESSGVPLRDVVSRLRELRRAVLPKNSRVVLYGSRVRGDAREDSDWDILILIDKSPLRRFTEDWDRYARPFSRLGSRLGEYFSVNVNSFQNWERQKASPFHRSVEREGIDIDE